MYKEAKSSLATFAGLNIAPGNTYYDGSTFQISADWNNTSYPSSRGLVSGSYYFTFNNINGATASFMGFSDWRMPTKAELQSIMGTSRAGSTINGTSGCCYTFIQLQGVTHADTSTPHGILIAPDNLVLTGMTRTLNWNVYTDSGNTGVSESNLNEYLSAGCVLIPASGMSDFRGDWYMDRCYWMIGQSYNYMLMFNNYFRFNNDANPSRDYMTNRFVRVA